MIKVLASDAHPNSDVWLKVKLECSTDILARELYTIDDVKHFQKEAIKKFLNHYFEEYWEKVENNS